MKNERGNAVIEFIAIGLVLQILVLTFLFDIGGQFRSQIAAESLARQLLRAHQLGSISSKSIIDQLSNLYSISPSEMSYKFLDNCQSLGLIQVDVQIRGKQHSIKGFCNG